MCLWRAVRFRIVHAKRSTARGPVHTVPHAFDIQVDDETERGAPSRVQRTWIRSNVW
ncbi:hypothetical protein BN2476_1150009 [Paraburkholderia piptadeniae]|uniref:Uncharacterized protein n=1 Tax=Paraburkholderia piptadeniae TaxID=1701573 RepID=A0A1N7SV82_9BURK|nr:hypothetical protein BN2476_1150009 [Paraburkholderia piptadeniae]